MANRTFKVYGQAYAASGDVTAVLTVGGKEVFNGAVNDSTTVREGQPAISNHLFTFTLDEAVIGGQTYSLAISGGELCLGQTEYNGIENQTIPDSWFAANAPDTTNVSAAAQTHIANTLGESALTTAYYNELLAGTAPNPTEAQLALFATANTIVKDWTVWGSANDTRTGAEVNDTPLDGWTDETVNKGNWPILQDGDVFTCTWNIDPTSTAPNSD